MDVAERGGVLLMGYVYLLTLESGETKIGCSKNPFSRLRSLDTGCPIRMGSLLLEWQGKKYKKVERLLHKMFDENRLKGEWFYLGPEQLLLARNIARWPSLKLKEMGME